VRNSSIESHRKSTLVIVRLQALGTPIESLAKIRLACLTSRHAERHGPTEWPPSGEGWCFSATRSTRRSRQPEWSWELLYRKRKDMESHIDDLAAWYLLGEYPQITIDRLVRAEAVMVMMS
jgi:hypothetical protein